MKTKRFGAIAIASAVAIQLLGVTPVLAAPAEASDCDFGRRDLEITLGKSNDNGGGRNPKKADATIWIDEDGVLYCDSGENASKTESAPAASIESITVEMDDDDSNGRLIILLDDDASGSQGVAEWPDFDTFDIDVTTRLVIDGSNVDAGAGSSLRVVVGAKTLAFSGTEATFKAGSVYVQGGAGRDTLDASKATVRVTVDGNGDKDLIRGGANRDTLNGDGGLDTIYGGGGNDAIDCGGQGSLAGKTFEYGWGGAGHDDIRNCNVVAPGEGDDDVDGNVEVVTYQDLTKGVEWTDAAGEISTAGAAGDDTFGASPVAFTGSLGADVIFTDASAEVKGLAGNDAIRVAYNDGGDGPTVYGGGGNDLVVSTDAAGASEERQIDELKAKLAE